MFKTGNEIVIYSHVHAYVRAYACVYACVRKIII